MFYDLLYGLLRLMYLQICTLLYEGTPILNLN